MTEPFFQNDIISTIFRNLNFYFFGAIWYKYAIPVFVLLFLITFGVYKNNKIIIPLSFSKKAYSFSHLNYSNDFALALCIIIISFYTSIMYLVANSLFNNYDLMSLNTTFILKQGMAASYGTSRLCPISFFDVNIIYAITHNYNLINLIILAKQILIALLLYHYLNFMSISKRLLTISAILISPAVFWINNIIYPEQNMLIFVISSLICARKYYQNQKFSYLFYFTLFTNLAIYTKETVTVFYAGFLIFSILYHVYNENINLSNIWKVFKLTRLFPIETIISASLFIFAIFYLFLVSETKENFYIFTRNSPIIDIINLYKLEFVLITVGWVVAIIKLIKKTKNPNPVFNEGLLFAGSFLLIYLTFYLRIIPILEHVSHKSYYAILTTIFGIIYLAQNIKSKKVLIALLTLMIGYSSVINYKNYNKENGIYYQEVAEYFSEELKTKKQLNIMISKNSEQTDWAFETWSSSYKYYFPNDNITFKFAYLAEDSVLNQLSLFIYNKNSQVITKIKGAEIPEKEDYFIIKKGVADKDFEIIKDQPHKLVYENKLFKVYQIK